MKRKRKIRILRGLEFPESEHEKVADLLVSQVKKLAGMSVESARKGNCSRAIKRLIGASNLAGQVFAHSTSSGKRHPNVAEADEIVGRVESEVLLKCSR